MYVKNVHPVYGAGIRTHDLHNMCLLPLPLNQGTRPKAIVLPRTRKNLTKLQSRHEVRENTIYFVKKVSLIF